jgi:hypothetical protein
MPKNSFLQTVKQIDAELAKSPKSPNPGRYREVIRRPGAPEGLERFAYGSETNKTNKKKGSK